MIYHLNYGKYLRPMSKEKLDLHYLWLSHLTDNIVPEMLSLNILRLSLAID